MKNGLGKTDGGTPFNEVPFLVPPLIVESKIFTFKINNLAIKSTHTQCVFHIIRLRLIIFHTPKNFHGRNKI